MSVRALVLAVALVTAVSGASLLSVPHASAKRDRLKPTPCTVAPRTLTDSSGQPAATPLPLDVVGFEADAWVDTPEDLPQGDPASEETVAEITAAVQAFAGCLNTGDGLRVTALMSDRAAAYLTGDEVLAAVLGPVSEENDSATIEVAWLRLGDIVELEDGRAGTVVKFGVDYEGRTTGLPATFHFVFAKDDGRWLLDAQVNIESDAYATISPDTEATPATIDDDALLDSARNGFAEVDSAMYAEPTMAGAKFSLVAMLMVGFLNEDDYPADIGCEMFIFERGAVSATVSAYCRADPALAGRAAYLDVKAYGPDRGASGPLYGCEDVAALADQVIFSCTADLPLETR